MRPSGSLFDGGILRPNGRAAPRPAPFARPRPPKACIPLRSSALCLSVRLRRPDATRPPATPAAAFVLPGRTQHRSLSGEGEARLPAVPRGEWTASRRAWAAPAGLCPASSPNKSGLRPANARFRSHSSAITILHFSPAPRASLSWPVCSVCRPTVKPCSPTRLTHGQLPPSGTTSTARHSASRQVPRIKLPTEQQRLRRRCGVYSYGGDLGWWNVV